MGGRVVARASSTAYPTGMAALASGWHAAAFDGFSAVTAPPPQPAAGVALLREVRRFETDYSRRDCKANPHPVPTLQNFTGHVGLAFRVSGGAPVRVTALMRFVVDGSTRSHRLDLLQMDGSG